MLFLCSLSHVNTLHTLIRLSLSLPLSPSLSLSLSLSLSWNTYVCVRMYG